MNYKIFLSTLCGALIGQTTYHYFKDKAERPPCELGTHLDHFAKNTMSANVSLQAKLIIAELELIDPEKFNSAKSKLEELIAQNIQEDIKIRAKLILARHLRKNDPKYANKLFEEVAQQTLNINEQIMAKFFMAEQMMVKNPAEAITLLESIFDKAKEINKDLAARIESYIGQLLYSSNPERSKILLQNASKQDFNKLVKEQAQKILEPKSI